MAPAKGKRTARASVREEWGTPDPQDPSAYPAVQGTELPQWAWEFLRRRPDYRTQWNQRVRPFLKGAAWDEDAIRRHHDEAAGCARQTGQLDWRAPWEALRDEFRVASRAANGSLDPRRSAPPRFEGLDVVEVLYLEGRIKPPHVVLQFDITLPIEPQLKSARAVLQYFTKDKPTKRGRNAPKLPIEKFPRYLRLLDFDDIRASDKEIGQALFPNHSGAALHDQISKNFKAARRWQQDYLVIALRSSPGA